MKFVPFESLLVKFWREITVLTNYANYKIMLINTLKSRVYRLVTAKFGFSGSKSTKSTIPNKLALKSHKDGDKDRSTLGVPNHATKLINAVKLNVSAITRL